MSDYTGRRLDVTTYREPTITKGEDGTLTLDWPDGLLATSIAREVIEDLVVAVNVTRAALRALVAVEPTADYGGGGMACHHCGQSQSDPRPHTPSCVWLAAKRWLDDNGGASA